MTPRDRHLMDPAVLRANYERAERAREQARREGRPVSTRGETVYVTDRPPSDRPGMALETVRRIVIAALVVTTLVHLTGGFVVAGLVADDRPARIGLEVMASVTGVLTVVSALLVFRYDLRSRAALWLPLGLVPGLLGLWLTLQ
ncbi:hypothetical protein GCM10011519_09820 [Marmoricola endophyticus]|uniref:Uncharacterized protein n=1 Tax=Marmoricola endophyticus TaxID=2040280 RepID=A0A917EZY2_9ACTN|nr:hypothetical protein [Marmoricola endophyticus]GGF38278.1 hypothetical protein GCM10011519_09820 [Marmoricola endophyticus]